MNNNNPLLTWENTKLAKFVEDALVNWEEAYYTYGKNNFNSLSSYFGIPRGRLGEPCELHKHNRRTAIKLMNYKCFVRYMSLYSTSYENGVYYFTNVSYDKFLNSKNHLVVQDEKLTLEQFITVGLLMKDLYIESLLRSILTFNIERTKEYWEYIRLINATFSKWKSYQHYYACKTVFNKLKHMISKAA